MQTDRFCSLVKASAQDDGLTFIAWH